jgi:hypothetical protein
VITPSGVVEYIVRTQIPLRTARRFVMPSRPCSPLTSPEPLGASDKQRLLYPHELDANGNLRGGGLTSRDAATGRVRGSSTG